MKNDLQNAFEFYDGVVKLKWDSDERLAVGTDHIDWVLKAARQAADDIERLVDHAALLGWQITEGDPDCADECNDGFRSLPDHLQALLNEEQERIDTEHQERDPTPWCHICAAPTQETCSCPPFAENH